MTELEIIEKHQELVDKINNCTSDGQLRNINVDITWESINIMSNPEKSLLKSLVFYKMYQLRNQ